MSHNQTGFFLLIFLKSRCSPFILKLKGPFACFTIFMFKGNIYIYIYIYIKHGCQNFDLDPIILRFYDLTSLKWSKFFKDLCDRSRSIGLYNSKDLTRSWFLKSSLTWQKARLDSKRFWNPDRNIWSNRKNLELFSFTVCLGWRVVPCKKKEGPARTAVWPPGSVNCDRFFEVRTVSFCFSFFGEFWPIY